MKQSLFLKNQWKHRKRMKSNRFSVKGTSVNRRRIPEKEKINEQKEF